MDHAYIEANQVVDRYLMEKLTTAEAARFEAHYLGCQQCLDQLELAETFLSDFRRSAARQAARAAGLGVLAWLARRRAHQVALVAGALLVAVLVPVRFERRLTEERQARDELTEQLAQAHRPQVDVLVLPLRKERSGTSTEPSRQIRLGPSSEWFVFSLELDTSTQMADRYRVTLIDENDKEVWRSEAFEPDALGGLTLSLHSSWLEPGDYRMQAEAVEPPAGPTSATYFSFRVLPRP